MSTAQNLLEKIQECIEREDEPGAFDASDDLFRFLKNDEGSEPDWESCPKGSTYYDFISSHWTEQFKEGEREMMFPEGEDEDDY